MATTNSFLTQIASGDNVKGYDHANKIFVSGGSYLLAPKYQFVGYCRITLNPSLNQDFIFSLSRSGDIGCLVKTFDLPKFTIDTKNLNAYNRPNIVQSKIKYDPINITFHDDSADTIRELWFNYYNYYYRDSDYEESVYRGGQGSKYGMRFAQGWGYNPNSTYQADQHLISKIELFSFHQKKFSSYVLYNPMITNFKHGQIDYSASTGTLENQMTIAYESIKYEKGSVTEANFQDMLLHYDRSPSPLTVAGGGTTSIIGPGGVVQAASEVIGDLKDGNPFSAAFKGLRAAQNFKGVAIGAVAGATAIGLVKDVLRGGNSLGKANFPSLGSLTSSLGGGASGSLSKLASSGIASVQGALSGVSTGSVASLATGAVASAKTAISNITAKFPSNFG